MSDSSQTAPHRGGVPIYPSGSSPFYRVPGPKTRRLADLGLHKGDLEFSLGCLTAFDTLPGTQHLLREALWRTAIAHYFKCLGDAGKRFQMDPRQVYKDQPREALEAFTFFKSYRNKHLIHDENAYSGCEIAAAIAGDSVHFKVAAIVPFVKTANACDAHNLQNLRLLIQQAITWVNVEFERRAKSLRDELEQLPYSQVTAHPGIEAYVPGIEDVHKSRS